MNKEFDVTYDIDKDYYGHAQVSQVYVKVVAQKREKDYLLKFNLKTNIFLGCARCLEQVEIPINEEFYRVATQNPTSEDEVRIESGEFLIDDAVFEELGLLIPSSVLCSNDCTGLCEVCGSNLKTNKCGCDRSKIDPRLSQLQKLIK